MSIASELVQDDLSKALFEIAFRHALQHKKKKPKFKPRPVALAKRLTSIKS